MRGGRSAPTGRSIGQEIRGPAVAAKRLAAKKSDEALKQEAVAKLEKGGLFAFGVSERTHGSDLFANEFTVKKAATGGW